MSQGEHIFRSRKGCKLQLVEVHITLAKVNKFTPTGTEFSCLHTFPELIFFQFRCIEHAMFWVEDTLDNECKILQNLLQNITCLQYLQISD
jgi:hypothetical protein